jgi:hypothetical protein
MAIWNIFANWYIYGHLVKLVVIWYIFSRFGMFYQEKSGNPGYIEKEDFDFSHFRAI